jgi:regulator of CtrA degradation
LTQRAIESGEIPLVGGHRPERRVGNAQDSDPAVVERLPEAARKLINASADLYARVKRIDEGNGAWEVPQSPARALMGRLERGLVGDKPA